MVIFNLVFAIVLSIALPTIVEIGAGIKFSNTAMALSKDNAIRQIDKNLKEINLKIKKLEALKKGVGVDKQKKIDEFIAPATSGAGTAGKLTELKIKNEVLKSKIEKSTSATITTSDENEIQAYKEELDAVREGLKTEGFEETAKTGSTKTADDTIDLIRKIAMFISKLLSPLIAINMAIIGALMDNDFIIGDGGSEDGTITKIGDILKMMWIIMRDIVNYLFIVILIIIAFMTVVTAGKLGDSNFEVKTALPKLLVGVVIVNFTWFFYMVIIDIANIATHVVYGIPQSIPGVQNIVVDDRQKCIYDWDRKKGDTMPSCPVSVVGIDISNAGKAKLEEIVTTVQDDTVSTEEDKNNWTTDENGNYVKDMEWAILTMKKFSWDDFNENSIVSLFAYGIAHVEQLPMVTADSKEITDLTVKTLVSFVVAIILIIVLNALLFAMLERVFVIWINLILSPIQVLIWVLRGVFSSVPDMGSDGYLGLSRFIAMAFLPATIGLPLVLGFIMIMVIKSVSISSMEGGLLNNIKGWENLLPNVTDTHQVLWFFMTIYIMWESMNMASNTAKGFSKGIIDKMKSTSEEVGGFIAKTPFHVPIIPFYSKDNKTRKIATADIEPLIESIIGDRSTKSSARARAAARDDKKYLDSSDINKLKSTIGTSKLKTFYNVLKNNPDKTAVQLRSALKKENINEGHIPTLLDIAKNKKEEFYNTMVHNVVKDKNTANRDKFRRGLEKFVTIKGSSNPTTASFNSTSNEYTINFSDGSTGIKLKTDATKKVETTTNNSEFKKLSNNKIKEALEKIAEEDPSHLSAFSTGYTTQNASGVDIKITSSGGTVTVENI